MDVFIEQLVKKTKTQKDSLLSLAVIAGGMVASILLFTIMMYLAGLAPAFASIISTVAICLVAGLWYLVYNINCSFNVEYEYIVINSNLDIDKITAKKRRKRVLSLDIKDAQLMACIKDAENNASYKNSANVEVMDFCPDIEGADTYFIEYSAGGKKKLVLFQPNEKIVDGLWNFNPKSVKKYNG